MTASPAEPLVTRARPSLLAFWGWRVVAAALVGAPLAFELSAAGAASTLSGDRELFAPGLLFASDLVRLQGASLSAALKTGGVIWLALAVLGSLPLAALLNALSQRDPLSLREHYARAARVFPVLLGLGGTILLAQFAWLLASSLLAAALGASLGHRGRAPALAPLGAYGLGLLGLLALGVWLDLARAAAIRHELRVRPALAHGLTALRTAAGAAFAGYFACAGGSLLALAGAAAASQALDVSRSGQWRILAVLVAHQLALLAFVLLRARWLARAVELVASEPR